MKHEAKFSVIMPAEVFSSAQIETFEQTAHRYKLPVELPLHADRAGNFIVASGMPLRDAQILRRQVAGMGFPADVVSDASDLSGEHAAAPNVTLDTLVVELRDLPSEITGNSVADITSAAWSSLELPSSLDLGLQDGAELSNSSRWSGDNWLSPESAAEKTLSLNAHDLLKVAQNSAHEAVLAELNTKLSSTKSLKQSSSQLLKQSSSSEHPSVTSLTTREFPVSSLSQPSFSLPSSQEPEVSEQDFGEQDAVPADEAAQSEDTETAESVQQNSNSELPNSMAIEDVIETREMISLPEPLNTPEESEPTQEEPEPTQEEPEPTPKEPEPAIEPNQTQEPEAPKPAPKRVPEQIAQLPPENDDKQNTLLKIMAIVAIVILIILIALALVDVFVSPIF